jgi:hypothetical protein
MSTREAVTWSAGGGVLFALGMMILALVANGQDAGFGLKFAIGSVLFMSLLLAVVGAVIGAVRSAATLAPDRQAVVLPPAAVGSLRIVSTPLIGLGALLAVTAVIGFVHLEVQSIRGQQEALSVRTELGAAIENILLVPDIAVDVAGLALLAEFDESVLPVDDDEQEDLATNLDDEGNGRIFAYSGALPIYVFLPEMLILLAAALATGVYSGFATARRAAAPTQLIAVGWGALTGIVWAIALVILRALSFGASTLGDSVFAGALLIGTAAGAIGGLLAFRPVGGLSPPPDGIVHG